MPGANLAHVAADSVAVAFEFPDAFRESAASELIKRMKLRDRAAAFQVPQDLLVLGHYAASLFSIDAGAS